MIGLKLNECYKILGVLKNNYAYQNFEEFKRFVDEYELELNKLKTYNCNESIDVKLDLIPFEKDEWE